MLPVAKNFSGRIEKIIQRTCHNLAKQRIRSKPFYIAQQLCKIKTQAADVIFFFFSLSLFIFFASRPPLGGIDDGAGGFAQSGYAVCRLGNDGEQRLYGLEKLWPFGAERPATLPAVFLNKRTQQISKDLLGFS